MNLHIMKKGNKRYKNTVVKVRSNGWTRPNIIVGLTGWFTVIDGRFFKVYNDDRLRTISYLE